MVLSLGGDALLDEIAAAVAPVVVVDARTDVEALGNRTIVVPRCIVRRLRDRHLTPAGRSRA